MFHLFIFQLFDFLVKCLIAIAQILCFLVCKQNRSFPQTVFPPPPPAQEFICATRYSQSSVLLRSCCRLLGCIFKVI